MAEIRSLLDEVIEAELQNLTSVTFGSAEETTAIRNLAALHKLRIDEMKAQTEADEKRRYLFNCVDERSGKPKMLTYQRYQKGFAMVRDELKLKPNIVRTMAESTL